MKNKSILSFALFIYFIVYFSLLSIQAAEYKSNEEASIETSSLLFQPQQKLDFDQQLSLIKKMVKEEQYSNALERSLLLLSKIPENNISLKFQLESELSVIYTRTNLFEESLLYAKKALSTLNQMDELNVESDDRLFFDSNLIDTYLKIGSQFFKLQRLEKADTLKRNLLDSAKYYYLKIENFPSLNSKVLDTKGRAFTSLSGLFYMDAQYGQAEQYALKAIEIHKMRKNKMSQAAAINNLANIYLHRQKLQLAKTKYLEGIELIDDYNTTKAVEFKADLYNNLAWTMRKLEDFNAYDTLEKAIEFTDAIRDLEIKRIIEDISMKYNVEGVKKDAELAKRNFLIFFIVSLLIITLLATTIILTYQRRKRLALELENSDMIQKQQVAAMRSESQKRILNAVIEGKEKERKEIAETLHDSVSTLLSSANLHLQASAKQFEAQTPTEILKAKRIITEASKKIRDLSHNLISAILVKFGLTYAIKDLAQKYSNSDLRIETEFKNISRYSEKFEIKVYNIIQEFMNNILKHSEATKALIKIEDLDQNIKIYIHDNGVGFNLSSLEKKEGIGIRQIEARVQLMNGDFKIESIIDQGTQIEISIPTIEIERQAINV